MNVGLRSAQPFRLLLEQLGVASMKSLLNRHVPARPAREAWKIGVSGRLISTTTV